LLLTFNLWLNNNVVSCSSQEEETFVPSCVIQTSLEGCCEVLWIIFSPLSCWEMYRNWYKTSLSFMWQQTRNDC